MNNTESFEFSTDISQLMNLLINSLYTHKDIFLRELISNSADALDKIEHGNKNGDLTLEIRIIPNKDNKTITIVDTGIGMTKKELINNLGIVAKSGTKSFMQKLKSNEKDISMIGKFGVGFYSAYLVAKKVTVITKSDLDEQYRWESSANNSFTITKDNSNFLKRGTSVILHIKDELEEIFDDILLPKLIKLHSSFVGYPIFLYSKLENGEHKFKLINEQKPIWSRDKSEITDKEYTNFYKNITGDWDTPLAVKHITVKDETNFSFLLFVPSRAPTNLFGDNAKQRNLRLYVRRVFVSDDSEQLIPNWMRFIRGIVDSEDLPLTISREMLQKNEILDRIKREIEDKAIELFSEIAEDKEKFTEFYKHFSKCLKLGLRESRKKLHTRIASLFRFRSTHSDKETVSFDDYISRMKDKQQGIYYITGETYESIKDSPFVEKLKAQNSECLYLCDPMDEYVVQTLSEYKNKILINVSQEKIIFETTKDDQELLDKYEVKLKILKEYIYKTLVGLVENVIVSTRLISSPCCISTNSSGFSANMASILKSQALRVAQKIPVDLTKKTFEINIKSPIIIRLLEKTDNLDESDTQLIHMLHGVARLTSGFTLKNPVNFSHNVYELLRNSRENLHSTIQNH